MQKDWLEDLVVRETMKLIQDDAMIDKIVQLVMDVQNQENTTIPLLEKQYHVIDTFAPDPEAKVAIWYGSNEPNMKKAMQKLKRAYPNAQDHPFVGYGHGDIIGHPDVMARDIIAFMKS